jgi:long-chain alkane monooxygenase
LAERRQSAAARRDLNAMTRQIRFNAFDMNCVGHQSPGLWAHPRDRSWQYKDLEYWSELAQLLERGKFDGLFIADVLGVYDVYRGNLDAALRHSTQIPVNDPLQLVPAMAMVTKHLGFGLTASLSFEHPYTFARRLSTLDHLTKGRAGWNIVTSYLDSGAKNIGLGGQASHDDRYDVADEYLEVCYKLWEGSWADGAVLRDCERRIFTDPTKVRPIAHEGRYFKVPGVHLSEPSPQRTPVLYQAGASSRGQRFAGQHAECVFVATPSKPVLKKTVAAIRQSVAAAGRDPHGVLIFNLQTAIVDESDAKAKAKFEDYRQYIDLDGALALGSGWMGIDFGAYKLDEPLRHIKTNAVQSSVDAFSSADPGRVWTARELAEWIGIGGLGPVLVGGPQTVADLMQEWVEDTDVDGFNLAYAVTHETFEDIVEHLVPELQKRGAYKDDYANGTLREKLFGEGPRLPDSHPGARYRDLSAGDGRALSAAE